MKLQAQHYFILSNLKANRSNKSIRRLKAKYLKDNLGSNYIEYVRDLEEEGYITRGKSYSPNHYSKQFQLTEKGEAVKMTTEVKQLIAPYVAKLLQGFQKEITDPYAVENLKATVELIQSGRLTLSKQDLQRAIRFISEKDCNSIELDLKIKNAKAFYYSLQNKVTWAALDTDGGNRIYTILQNMPKELRQFIQIDNEYCHEFDLTNAQPFFLASYLAPRLFGEDVYRFYKLTSQGSWNSFLAIELGLPIKDVKQLFINYLFSNSYDHGLKSKNLRIDTFMEKHFPNIHAFILKNNFYKEISRILRELESKWAHRAIFEIRKMCAGYTVHDAIVVKQSGPLHKIFEYLKDSISCSIKHKDYNKINIERINNRKKEIEKRLVIRKNNKVSINVTSPFTPFQYVNPNNLVNKKINDFYKDFSPDKPDIYDLFKKSSKKQATQLSYLDEKG